MKKILLALVFLCSAFSLKAQSGLYVGGEVSFWRNHTDNHTNFTFQPEVGYNLSNTWAIGGKLLYVYDYDGKYEPGTKNTINAIGVNPYVRWNAIQIGKVSFFVDGGFTFLSSHIEKKGKNVLSTFTETNITNTYNAWEIGLKPGIKYDINQHVSLIAHLGTLGYRDADDDYNSPLGSKGFGFSLSGNSLSFGLNYTF